MLVEQVYIFLWSIATGIVLGLLFDFFRAFRFRGIKDVWVYIQDVIFWLVTAVIIIASAFIINEGELRGYMLIGYLLGAAFYMLMFSKFVLHLLKSLIDIVIRGYKFLTQKSENIFSGMRKEKKLEIRQEI